MTGAERQAGSPVLRFDDFSLPTTAEGGRSLSSSLSGRRGGVVVFWSSACSHCRRYDAYLNAFRARFPDLALLVIGARQGESARLLARRAAERRLTFDPLHDAELTLARIWRVTQTPCAFLLDRQRRLCYRGAIDNFKYPDDPAYRAYLDLAIEDFMADREIGRPATSSFGCPVRSVYYEA